jgi:hypothetical protein
MKINPGSCGNCPWFTAEGRIPPEGQYQVGVCSFNPPVAAITMGQALGPQGPMAVPALQGLRPPTKANDKCSNHPFYRSNGYVKPINNELEFKPMGGP